VSDALLIVVRAVHIGACVVLMSLFVFELFIVAPSIWKTDGDFFQRLRIQFWWLAVESLLIAICSGAVWLWIVAAQISGSSLFAALNFDSLRVTLSQTRFGQLWELRLSLMLLLGIVMLIAIGARRHKLYQSRGLQIVGLVGATVVAGSLAWAGHAGAMVDGGKNVHLIADAMHLVAAGIWPGALLPLCLLLTRIRSSNRQESLAITAAVIHRFSTVSISAVSLLAASGIINSYFLVGSFRVLLATSYGQFLSLKLLLFAIMICIGAWNRCCLQPRLRACANTHAHEGRNALKALVRDVYAELCFGSLILLIVGAMGAIAPAAHHHL